MYTLNPEIELYRWQKECLNIWEQKGCRGTIDVVTGAGKTIFAIAALCRLSSLSSLPLRVRIVLPKHSLIRQWISVLRFSVQEDLRIGQWHGQRKDSPDCEVMIYIVNSARHAISSHILQDQADGYASFLIADECHHYMAGENLKIFHFTDSPDFSNEAFFSLGLSATLDGASESREFNRALGQQIYSYRVSDALLDGHISSFVLFDVQIELNAGELSQLAVLESRIAGLLAILRRKYSEPSALSLGDLIEFLRRTSSDSFAADSADKLELLLRQKQTITVMAASRVPCALKLIEELPSDSRILIFCERIRQAEQLYREITVNVTGHVSIFHSNLTAERQKDALGSFKNGDSRILVSCRALDEGIDVPDCDIGIILSTSASRRQHIQRLGRMLRTSPGKQMASIYYIYAKGQESSDFLKEDPDRFPHCSLRYLHCENDFINPELEEVILKILREKEGELGCNELAELRKCFLEGFLKADYLLDPETLMIKIKKAADRHTKNYWYACLLLHREVT